MTDLATNVLYYGDNLDILRRYLGEHPFCMGGSGFGAPDCVPMLVSPEHQCDGVSDSSTRLEAVTIERVEGASSGGRMLSRGC